MSGDFNLHISSVRSEDNGSFVCQVNTDPPINQVGTALGSLARLGMQQNTEEMALYVVSGS